MKKQSLRKEIVEELGKGVPVELILTADTVLKTKRDMKKFEDLLNNHMVVNCFFKPLQRRIDDVLMKQEGNGRADWVDALNAVKKDLMK